MVNAIGERDFYRNPNRTENNTIKELRRIYLPLVKLETEPRICQELVSVMWFDVPTERVVPRGAKQEDSAQ